MKDNLVPKDSLTKSRSAFNIRNVPLVLYEEASRHFGVGDEMSQQLQSGGFWRQRLLRQEDPRVGFPGTIRIRTAFSSFIFELWPVNMAELEVSEDSVFFPNQILEVVAGPRSTGSWGYGQGELMTDDAGVHFGQLGKLNLKAVELRLACALMIRAQQIALHPQCVASRYWEADLYPDGDFTSPSF